MNSRRNFIKTIGRSLVAGTILGASGYLLLRDPSGDSCNFDFPCNNCKRLLSCSDQKAMDFKDKGKGASDEQIR